MRRMMQGEPSAFNTEDKGGVLKPQANAWGRGALPSYVGRGLVPRHRYPLGTSPSATLSDITAEPVATTSRSWPSTAGSRGYHLRLPAFPVILATVALLLALLIAPVARADSPVDDIAGQLACQCGCGLTALACGGAMQCDVGDQMVALIRTKVNQEESREQILAYFVTQYGEKVLAAPTKEGFNLTAWIAPFLAVAGGGAVVFFVLRDWLAKRRIREETEPPAPADLGGYGERIDRELEQFG